jgi:hypothetical protein
MDQGIRSVNDRISSVKFFNEPALCYAERMEFRSDDVPRSELYIRYQWIANISENH